MKTTVLFIDDTRAEIEDLMDSLKAELGKLDPYISVRAFNDTGISSLAVNVTSLVIQYLDTSLVDEPAKDCAGNWNQHDLFMIDLCWDGDKKDRRGWDFCNQLVSIGVSRHRITIITNNTTVAADIERGMWGGAFVSCSKGNVARLASILFSAMCRPLRLGLLGLATSINEKIHRDESVLERFFHQSRTPRPSKADVINVCAELRTALPTLPEAGWLANALEHYLEGKHDQDPVGGNLSDYLANDQLRANVIKAEVEELQPIVEIGKNNSGGHKLKDLLFPRVSDVSGKPFRTYGDQLMKVFSVLDLNWQVDGHPIPAASNLKARTDGIVEGAVPLSWFSDFITDKDWLKDLAAHFQCHSNCAPLKVAVVQTRSPEHVCVMFWHSGNGFCDEATLSACAAKMLQVAVEFSHIFIASTCENGTRALVELLPEGNVRRIPACKVSFGETCFDFSEWENGSAYLFAVPGSV